MFRSLRVPAVAVVSILASVLSVVTPTAGAAVAPSGIWTDRTSNVAPPGRQWPAAAFDEVRGRAVLFGGLTAPSYWSQSVLADTWEWDGTSWEQQHPTIAPAARYGAASFYDPVRERVVIFG